MAINRPAKEKVCARDKFGQLDFRLGAGLRAIFVCQFGRKSLILLSPTTVVFQLSY